jgi:hypothetical protein
VKAQELREFSELLTRLLARVLGGENGYVEGLCPECRGSSGRSTPPDERESAVCRTCEGGNRIWTKSTPGGVRRLSDRQMILTFGRRVASHRHTSQRDA